MVALMIYNWQGEMTVLPYRIHSCHLNILEILMKLSEANIFLTV